MHELKRKLCPRWLGWSLVAVGWALIGAAVWAWSAGRESLGLTLLIVSAVYVVALILAAVVTIVVRRMWRDTGQDRK